MADSEFDAQMTRLDQRIAAMNKRLDAMANVNEHLIADGERLQTAMNRLDNTLLSVIERVDLLGGSFGEVFDRLIAHIREHGGQP